MCRCKKWLLILILTIPLAGFSQKMEPLNKQDFTSPIKDSVKEPLEANTLVSFKDNTVINFKTYFVLLGKSLKNGVAKPFHMHKKDWGNFGKFALGIAAFSFADEPVQQAAYRLRGQSSLIDNASKTITHFGGMYGVITVAGIGAYGLIFRKPKLLTTTLLASQAYITSATFATILKFLTGRARPSYYGPGIEAEPTFYGPFSKGLHDINGKAISSSFPSGHTTVAFAAATVFASEYKDHPLVPVFAYSAATLIGISRITENKHWTTDVLVGAALGFLSGKQVVNNFHRAAKMKANGQEKNSVSFNLNYNYGHWEPGLVYQFK